MKQANAEDLTISETLIERDMNMEQQAETLKSIVRDKYTEIAQEAKPGDGCGCGCGCNTEYTIDMASDYTKLEGYNPEADLGLGCGIPTEHAGIREGDTVLDLGSGAGNDVFVARRLVGERGKVIGVDMTKAMIERAEENKKKLGYTNVDFRFGEIENMPVESDTVDVVVSNCVLNLVPNKEKAFAEIFRVLKMGGRFSISDIVTRGSLPKAVLSVAELYAGCISGAVTKESYLSIVEHAGFAGVKVVKEKGIAVPDDLFLKHISRSELASYKTTGGILSVTVVGEKR